MNPFAYLRHTLPSWWSLWRAERPAGRIAVLQTVWGHHANRSGYRPVAEGLGVSLRSDRMNLLPGSLARRAGGAEGQAAAQVAFAMRRTGRDRLLVVDGDHQLELLVQLRRQAKVRVVAVFHQITRVLAERVAAVADGALDGAVCVARCQMALVERLAPAGCTWFVPHGVDAEWFRPGDERTATPTIVCVGRHCRDFATLRDAARLIKEREPAASVQLITAASTLPPTLDLGPVELRTDLSDEALRAAYQRAWVVLLPLTDATANNSLLEGMACGTPVVTTDVGGVRDYFAAAGGALCPPGDAAAHAQATLALLADAAKRAEAGRAVRQMAESFAWPRVRERVRQLLEA